MPCTHQLPRSRQVTGRPPQLPRAHASVSCSPTPIGPATPPELSYVRTTGRSKDTCSSAAYHPIPPFDRATPHTHTRAGYAPRDTHLAWLARLQARASFTRGHTAGFGGGVRRARRLAPGQPACERDMHSTCVSRAAHALSEALVTSLTGQYEKQSCRLISNYL